MDEVLGSVDTESKPSHEMLIKTHASMVKKIAHHLLGRLPQNVQFDDLIQAGMLGLLEAAKNYDETKGASFETYAGIRIRGHMLDEVRRNDWVPRSVYRNSRLISAAVRTVENREGRDAKDQEVALELGISLEEYHIMLNDAVGGHLYTFEDLGPIDDFIKSDSSPNTSEPHEDALKDDMRNILADVVNSLPHKERLVLFLYYEQDLNLKEIGEVLGVSESRVSQIHSQATLRIKSRLPEL